MLKNKMILIANLVVLLLNVFGFVLLHDRNIIVQKNEFISITNQRLEIINAFNNTINGEVDSSLAVILKNYLVELESFENNDKLNDLEVVELIKKIDNRLQVIYKKVQRGEDLENDIETLNRDIKTLNEEINNKISEYNKKLIINI